MLEHQSSLKKYANTTKAKKLLEEFFREASLTEKATALLGVCQVLGKRKSINEITRILRGEHELCHGLPLQTMERFISKYKGDFGNRKINIHKSSKKLSVVSIDKIMSLIHAKLYEIHAKIILDVD